MAETCSPVTQILRQTSKGRLVYDRTWEEEGRTKEVISQVESRLCALTIAPKEQEEVHLKREDKQTAEHELTCYEVEEELQAYEELRKENVKCSVEAYSRGVFDYLQETEDDADSEFRQIRQKHLDAAISRLNTYQEDYRKFMSQLIGRQSSLSSLQESISYKFQEVTSKHEEALAAKEREAQQKLRTDLISIHTKCQELLQDQLMPVFSQLSSLEHIPQNMAQHATQVYHEISVSLNGLLETISKEKLTSEDSKSASLIHREVQVKIQSAISELSRMKQEFEATTKTAPKMEAVAVTVPQPKVAKHGPDSILRSYFMRQKALSEFESKIKSFTDDLEEKSYRLSLQQYIRTNINAISTGSNEHLRQKFKNLNRLMSGEWIEFQDKKIIATKHQESLNFCRSYAAKTFISVGSKQVVSVPKAAFPMAAVISLLWSNHPVFGELFMAQMEEKCPYIGLYYPRREKDETEVSHLVSCGYVNGADNETLESQESFLNRMRAFSRLYGAIVASNMGSVHPHGISFAWMWLTQTLYQEPTPAVSAAVIHAFLSAAFYRMQQVYKSQAVKLLYFLKNDYIKRIEHCSGPQIKKQSIVQLEMFTSDCLKKIAGHRDVKPEGVVPDFFFQKSFLNSGPIN